MSGDVLKTFGVHDPVPTLVGFPAGRVKVLQRCGYFPLVYVRTPDGVRKFHPKALPNGTWMPGHEVGSNRTMRAQCGCGKYLSWRRPGPGLPYQWICPSCGTKVMFPRSPVMVPLSTPAHTDRARVVLTVAKEFAERCERCALTQPERDLWRLQAEACSQLLDHLPPKK